LNLETLSFDCEQVTIYFAEHSLSVYIKLTRTRDRITCEQLVLVSFEICLNSKNKTKQKNKKLYTKRIKNFKGFKEIFSMWLT